MSSSRIETTRLGNARIKWDAGGRPTSLDYGDIYFSDSDPVAESSHVFIAGTGVDHLLKQAGPVPIVIGECGFGFGLNFLNTWALFSHLAPPGARLHFISCELHPVHKSDLQRFYCQLPDALQPFADALLAQYPEQEAGMHRLRFQTGSNAITLDLLYQDAAEAFATLNMPEPRMDAWYLDGFAPAKNTATWSKALVAAMARLSKPGCRVATYSVAGVVRQHLEGAGFRVAKAPGYGRKRHMLTATLELSQPRSAVKQGWQHPWCADQVIPSRIAVVGGGLAGCATAAALAARGCKVMLFEQDEGLARAASGNDRGTIHLNLSRRLTAATRFHLAAYRFATRQYRTMAASKDIGWNQCGQLQLAASSRLQALQKDLVSSGMYDTSLIRGVNASEAASLAGIPINFPGVFFSESGSLDPAALCHAWCKQANITSYFNHELRTFSRHPEGWQLQFRQAAKNKTCTVEAVILCTASGSNTLPIIPEYPLVNNHGQVDTYRCPEHLPLSTTLAYQGYAVPIPGTDSSQLMLGGSFVQGRAGSIVSDALSADNLALLASVSPELAACLSDVSTRVSSRVGTRCTTPDYLPLAGPVEIEANCRELFAGYRRNARRVIRQNPDYFSGLYINTGHGSSALTTAPLVAEYLAGLVCRESLPLGMDEIAAIHPLRFLVRKLKKQQ